VRTSHCTARLLLPRDRVLEADSFAEFADFFEGEGFTLRLPLSDLHDCVRLLTGDRWRKTFEVVPVDRAADGHAPAEWAIIPEALPCIPTSISSSRQMMMR
jgi:hypothetical protein